MMLALGLAPPRRKFPAPARQALAAAELIAGLVLSGVTFALHVAALQEGPLTLVQPIVVTTVMFAVLVRAGLDRTSPIPAEPLVRLHLGGSHPVRDRRRPGQAAPGRGRSVVVAVPGRRGVRRRAGGDHGEPDGLAGAPGLPPRRRCRHPLRSDRGADQGGHVARTGRLIVLPIDHWSPWLIVPTGWVRSSSASGRTKRPSCRSASPRSTSSTR